MKTKILIVLIAIVIIAGCGDKKKPSSDKELQEKTETMMREANAQTGMPAIVNWQEKKLMKQIYELRDQEDLICFAYLYNRNTGEIGQFLGKCIGYGLPYSTQYSNPQKHVYNGCNSCDNNYEIFQPEPNGLFMPDGMAATWLLLIDPETNKPRPVYVEPEIIVSPFKLHK